MAAVVNVIAALDETGGVRSGRRHGLVASVFLTLKAILIDSGSMNEVPLVSGMRQTLEVAGEKELSGHVVGVAGFQLVVQALHQLILCSGCDYLHASLHNPFGKRPLKREARHTELPAWNRGVILRELVTRQPAVVQVPCPSSPGELGQVAL